LEVTKIRVHIYQFVNYNRFWTPKSRSGHNRFWVW